MHTAPAPARTARGAAKKFGDQFAWGNTLGQGMAALAWSVRMIGVAIAFLAPWALALGLVGWLVIRFARQRGGR